MVSRRPLVVFATALGLFAASCGGGTSSAGPVETASGAAVEQVAEAPTPEAPGLVASTVSGEQIDFGSLQGQDVLLWFWAPW